jgi:hypothetical protein
MRTHFGINIIFLAKNALQFVHFKYEKEYNEIIIVLKYASKSINLFILTPIIIQLQLL